MNTPAIHNRSDLTEIQHFLSQVSGIFARRPFRAHRVFSGGHAQTLAAYAWPRPYRLRTGPQDEQRLFEVEPNIKVLANCRWQKHRLQHSTMVIWHGMEGSTASVYMIAMADKAFRAGFNVVRVNYRNCGGTEHLSPTLYHGGLSSDLRSVINELITTDGLQRIFPVGFSLGGNMVLKLAGEYEDSAPQEILAACVVSPSVDLRASTDMMLAKQNWIYHRSFVNSLKARVRIKHRLFPDSYDLAQLAEIKSIRDFDERFTSVPNGFANADDYYRRSSAVRVVDKIRIPTLIIHSEDDPFIPCEPLRQQAFSSNPYLLMITTNRGGHVAFIADKQNGDVDRFWAENRVVEFCQLADEEFPRRS